MRLVVGLGNPGKSYQKTRHNIGFVVVDNLLKALNPDSNWSLSKKFNAEIAELNINDEKIILVKPMTFMNRSGEAVGIIINYYKIKPQDLIVIHDDKDLKLGDTKIQTNRGDAGHNGIKSIIEHLGTRNFTRVRIGVASTNEKKMANTGKFVLSKFALGEKKKVKEAIEVAVDKIKSRATHRV